MILKRFICPEIPDTNLEMCHPMDNYVLYHSALGAELDRMIHEYDRKIFLSGTGHIYYNGLRSLLDDS